MNISNSNFEGYLGLLSKAKLTKLDMNNIDNFDMVITEIRKNFDRQTRDLKIQYIEFLFRHIKECRDFIVDQELDYKTERMKNLNELKDVLSDLFPKDLIKKAQNLSSTQPISHKQQILMLHYLGWLWSTPQMTTDNRGKLIGYLLDKNAKNSADYIRYLNGAPDPKHLCKTEDNIKLVISVFEELGLEEPLEKALQDLKALIKKRDKIL